MRHPALDRLLILQDRDLKRLGIEAQLKAVPKEIAAVEQKIAAEKAAIENAKTELRTLESNKKVLETEIGGAETKLAKYKTQQMSVRKNDEFQALGVEIEHTQTAIDTLEEQEIGVMLQIDEAKKRFADAEKVLRENIHGHEERIRTLHEREVNLAAEHKTALEELAAARTPLEQPVLRLYDRTATRHQPAVVAIRGSKCSGCHLKVSSEVESEARRGENLPTCDQCGRIVWWES
ncbi:MAG TPA: C4-type zinc ribbon domain-containing protein [Opitutaceae bacterium]|nr:C4-type zinc ribbon domain-containing protein [Opitutaceae bacterium]